MNLNAIKRNCMARMTANIINALGAGQWLSNGQSAWRVDRVRLDIDVVVELFNMTGKKRAGMYMTEQVVSDPRFSITPVEGEEETDEIGAILWCDEIYLALKSARGTLFIPYVAVKHIKAESRRYGIRWRFDRPLVAVYGDLTCSALVLPLSDESAENIRRDAMAMAGPRYIWPDQGRDAADAEDAAEAMLRNMVTGAGDDA